MCLVCEWMYAFEGWLNFIKIVKITFLFDDLLLFKKKCSTIKSGAFKFMRSKNYNSLKSLFEIRLIIKSTFFLYDFENGN